MAQEELIPAEKSPENTEKTKKHDRKLKQNEIEHFSFQRTQLLTDQSQDEEDGDITGALACTNAQNLSGDLNSDGDDGEYDQNFAEEYRLKQEKMLGEL